MAAQGNYHFHNGKTDQQPMLFDKGKAWLNDN